ncbi:FAD-dependent oxidoreductase [Calycomorphotria hydatis]|uniref:Pentachlorophenol 4-monooxygenase n=1 Tax=Calycomorphotria hydatis TaxID=2528027 RepID=A0A517TEI1_9PLAN|nr:FAD-dependent oxidoreductase [Calycomorphotria hydatis]QDT66780.1 Pentachlorophenol 4-monooxygenase [Calycomorphotria hydatis]
MEEVQSTHTTCCVVGGGPAGVFLGYLLARAGVRVTVLEKHEDFFRDFRGDTIHPSTLELLHELGLLDEFLPLVDFRSDELVVNLEGQDFAGPMFKHLKTRCPFIGLIPQWDLLNFLSTHGKRFPEFDLRMGTEVTDVIRKDGKVVGVRARTSEGDEEIHADLVVAADGRHSTVREVTGHVVHEEGIPIDVLWFRLDRPANVDDHALAWLTNGHMMITLPRRDHYQTAMVIKKGAFETIQQEGIEPFRETIRTVCPLLADVVGGIQDWDQVKLLTVQINHLEKWHESGLLFIGDSAHAMSPVGGVGINLAIQDAVATANLLTEPLRNQSVEESHLAAVQSRRETAARRTQRVQSIIQTNLFGKGAEPGRPFSPPWYVLGFVSVFRPILRRVAGYLIGMGFRPEHVETADVH